MTDAVKLAIIRDKLIAIASELRGIKNDTGSDDADEAVESAEDYVDDAVDALRTALRDLAASS